MAKPLEFLKPWSWATQQKFFHKLKFTILPTVNYLETWVDDKKYLHIRMTIQIPCFRVEGPMSALEKLFQRAKEIPGAGLMDGPPSTMLRLQRRSKP